MRVLAVFNQKGGVGKTTLARAAAHFAARPEFGNLRVLVVDLDPQASFSKLCLDMRHDQKLGTLPPVHEDYNPDHPEDQGWDGRSSSANIFLNPERIVPYTVVKPTLVENLHLLPARKSDLSLVEYQDRGALAERVFDQLQLFCDAPEVQEAYDLIIFDIGPKESPLYTSALRAATHLLIPVVPERQCTDGLLEMLKLWGDERARRGQSGRELSLVGIAINKFDARYGAHKFSVDQMMDNPRIAIHVCGTVISQRASIMERDMATEQPLTVFDLPKSADVRQLMVDLMAEVFAKMFPEQRDYFEGLGSPEMRS